MANQPDHRELSHAELQQIVASAAEVPGETRQLHRILWQSDASDKRSPCLTVGLPRQNANDRLDAFTGRLVWWPQGVVTLRRIAVMSSRIAARHDQQTWWFDLLRTAILRIEPSEECVFAVQGTSTHDAAMRAAEIFGVPRFGVSVDDGDATDEELTRWLAYYVNDMQPGTGTEDLEGWQAHLSPRLISDRPPKTVNPAPLRDRVTTAAGERSYVLACRQDGHIYRSVKASLNTSGDYSTLICVAKSPGTSADCMNELSQLGAIPWLVDGISSRATLDDGHVEIQDCSAEEAKDGPLDQPQDWLCHWTRPCGGPWPGQPDTDYLDELLLGCTTADRSALATLLRIVSHRIVLASTIRNSHMAVSFTEVPLSTFRQRRVYRRHRRRYDFEPWGIAIRRDLLVQRGAQTVQYGVKDSDQADMNTASVWFQPATDQSGRIDWREEQEWRLADDLRLDEFHDSAICLFVDSPAEANIVRAQSNWRVVVVPRRLIK